MGHARLRPLVDDRRRRLADGLVAPWRGEAGQAAFYRQIAQADQRYTDEIEPLHPSLRLPVQVVWGTEDTWISAVLQRWLVQLGRPARVATDQPEQLGLVVGVVGDGYARPVLS